MAIRVLGIVLAAWLGSSAMASRVVAQAPLSLINPSTQVRTLEFAFEGGQSFRREVLEPRLALTEQGQLVGLRRTFSFLPLVPPVGNHPFDPVELQKDLIRLRRFYQASGFLESQVRYEVELDAAANAVKVRFVIREGRPLLLSELDLATGSGEDVASILAPELAPAWSQITGRMRSESVGRRLGSTQIRGIEGRMVGWLRDRGYPDAAATGVPSIDSTAATLALSLRVDPGLRKRVQAVTVQGNAAITDAVIRRELPVGPGDWFSAADLVDAERELFGLDMIRWADAAVEPGGDPEAEDVTLLVRVEEGPPRLISGRAGYASSSGVTTQAQWAHRNFVGAARVLTVSAEARTGFLTANETAERRYGLSVSVRQPYLGSRRISGLLTPFVEYRDGPIDLSWTNGVDATAIYDFGGLNSVALQYGISARNVIEYRFGTLTDTGTDFLALQTILDDSLGVSIRESRFTLSATAGTLDSRTRPRRGIVNRMAFQIAGPDALSRVEFAKMTGSVNAFFPVSGNLSARARVSAGRLYPYGKSVPGGVDDDYFIRFLELRDALMTSGGTADVRGWSDGLLGPKTPDFRLVESDSVFARADRYIPVGGFARFGFSTELAMPLPGSSRRHSIFAFFDGGKVWTPDSRFLLEDPFDEQRFFFGVGGGLEFSTLIGPVRIALGYKLNPSLLDVRNPSDVQRALAAGMPITALPEEMSRRFQLHIDLGRLF